MSVWSTQAANELISLSVKEKRPLTHMQIQKLVYISHGWSLFRFKESLTIDNPEAWRLGPVYRLLWNRLQYAGNYAVTKEIHVDELLPYPGAEAGQLRKAGKELIQSVLKSYGSLTAFRLSALTHQKGTPWRTIYGKGEGRDEQIPASLIGEHFGALYEEYKSRS